MSVYCRILKELGIDNIISHPLRNTNTVTDEQIKQHGLMTNKMFRDFQRKVLNKKLP